MKPWSGASAPRRPGRGQRSQGVIDALPRGRAIINQRRDYPEIDAATNGDPTAGIPHLHRLRRFAPLTPRPSLPITAPDLRLRRRCFRRRQETGRHRRGGFDLERR